MFRHSGWDIRPLHHGRSLENYKTIEIRSLQIVNVIVYFLQTLRQAGLLLLLPSDQILFTKFLMRIVSIKLTFPLSEITDHLQNEDVQQLSSIAEDST